MLHLIFKSLSVLLYIDPTCSSFRIFGLTLTNIFWQGGSWRYLKPPKVNSLGALKSAENAASHGEGSAPPNHHRLTLFRLQVRASLTFAQGNHCRTAFFRSSALDVGWSETVGNIWHVIWCIQFGCFKQLPNCICFERNQVDWINNPAPVFFVTLAVD